MPEFHGVSFELFRPVHPVTLPEVQAAEADLRCAFPSAYHDFVLEFGAGEFLGLTLRSDIPFGIIRRTAADQARLREYWFWDESPEVWSQQQACESIACFDGACGDDIRFHPSDPETMYLLPFAEQRIYRATSFAELVSSFARTALYDLSARPLVFEPWYPSPA